MTFLLLYLLMLAAIFLLQRQMIYFPSPFTPERQAVLLAQIDLQAWPSETEPRGFISKTPISGAKGTVLVFHGNAGSAVQRAYFINGLQHLGYRVVVAEYPGYGSREGSPSESILIQDGIVSAKKALQDFGGPLFLCGESLGSAVAAGIVASREVPVKGLLLITPFDSMVNVAHHHYWFFLAKWLLLDRYDNVARLRGFKGNVAVLMADQDEIIPTPRTMALFESLPASKRLWNFKNADHNTIPMEPWQPWWQQVMQFVDG